MRAWVFQDYRQKQKLGDRCPWSVGWIDPEGRRKSEKVGCRSSAEKKARKIEGQLEAGVYQDNARKSWATFKEEYETRVVKGMSLRTRRCTMEAIAHFERIIKPQRLSAIKSQTIDEYKARRRTEPGKYKGSTVSPATINKELRHLRAAIRIAYDWKYLPVVPKFKMVKEPKKLPRYVTPEHFAAIYQACDVATRPKSEAFEPADWWRALLTFCYMTGWRISEPLALKWDDVSLDEGRAITRAADNKGRRDEAVPLHSIVVDHLRRIVDLGDLVFSWPHHERTLWVDFARIQTSAVDEAGSRIIDLPCNESHEHTDACHLYGFHDLRRAFATLNAENMTADALQVLMRHRSYATTQRYINLAGQVNRAVEGLHVPGCLKRAGGIECRGHD